MQEIQDDRRIDTTSLEKEEEDLKDVLIKSEDIENNCKITLNQNQSELKSLKNEMANSERKKNVLDQQIREQESILNSFIDNSQSRARDVERKRKVVVSREKAVNDVARIVETQMNLRQQRIDEATAKVNRFKFILFYFMYISLNLFPLPLFSIPLSISHSQYHSHTLTPPLTLPFTPTLSLSPFSQKNLLRIGMESLSSVLTMTLKKGEQTY